MKILKFFYCYLAILFLLSQQSVAINQQASLSPDKANLEQCLRLSLRGSTPLDRDRARMDCVRKHKSSLNVSTCSKIAQTLEYSNFEDELKLFCMSDLPAKTNFRECFQLASSMIYVDNSEEAKWSCLKKFERQLSNKECLEAARKMKFSYNRQRIETFCQEELSTKM